MGEKCHPISTLSNVSNKPIPTQQTQTPGKKIKSEERSRKISPPGSAIPSSGQLSSKKTYISYQIPAILNWEASSCNKYNSWKNKYSAGGRKISKWWTGNKSQGDSLRRCSKNISPLSIKISFRMSAMYGILSWLPQMRKFMKNASNS